MASDLSERDQRGFSRMIKFPRWRRENKACSFLALPAEIRQQIYGHYFTDSYVRYSRRRGQYSVKNKRSGPAYCHGPDEISLLLTNRFVYQEALPILLSNITLLFERTDIFESLCQIYDHTYTPPDRTVPLHPNPMPSFLSNLISNARNLILSKVGTFYPHLPITELPHLETITLFGFYPSLRSFLSYGYTVAPSRRFWRLHWHLPWPRIFMQSFDNDVDFVEVTERLHRAFDSNRLRVQVRLKAWAVEDWSMMWDKTGIRLIELNTDLDDPQRCWTWDVLAYPEINGLKGRLPVGMQHPHLASISWNTFVKETTRRKEKAAKLFREYGGKKVSGQGRKSKKWSWPEHKRINADGGEAALLSCPTVSFAVTGRELELSFQDIGNDMLGLVPRQRRNALVPCAENEPSPRAALETQDWATITDSGDWQSERSVDVAFKEWDTALEL